MPDLQACTIKPAPTKQQLDTVPAQIEAPLLMAQAGSIRVGSSAFLFRNPLPAELAHCAVLLLLLFYDDEDELSFCILHIAILVTNTIVMSNHLATTKPVSQIRPNWSKYQSLIE
jgi:hypothetical protein